MGISGINAYLALCSMGGQEAASSEAHLAAEGAKATDLYTVIGSVSPSSLFDTVDFSRTAEFFSRLQQLGETDPEKYEQVVRRLGESLKSARGYAGQVLDRLIQKVSEGQDIAEVVMPASSVTGLYAPTGTSAEKVQELMSGILSGLDPGD